MSKKIILIDINFKKKEKLECLRKVNNYLQKVESGDINILISVCLCPLDRKWGFWLTLMVQGCSNFSVRSTSQTIQFKVSWTWSVAAPPSCLSYDVKQFIYSLILHHFTDNKGNLTSICSTNDSYLPQMQATHRLVCFVGSQRKPVKIN